MSKPVLMWAVCDEKGKIVKRTIGSTRSVALLKFLSWHGDAVERRKAWLFTRRKYGYSVRRVEVREVEP